jgi:CheY-like chemotaxis protein
MPPQFDLHAAPPATGRGVEPKPSVVRPVDPPAGEASLGVGWPSAGAVGPPSAPADRGGIPFLTDGGASRGDLGPDGADPLQGATVLVVDDDVRNVFALTSALEMFGMRVQYADNGRDAVKLLQQASTPVNLVLMDVMLPGMDGNQTTAVIRAMPAFAELPILVLTAQAMPGDREKSIAAGASDYITKPVNLDHLLTVMRSHL